MFFVYDSLPPEVEIEKYIYNDENYIDLIFFSGITKEANLKEVTLEYIYDEREGYTSINHTPKILSLGGDIYRIVWEGLDSYIYPIEPNAVHKLKIKVTDHAGNPAETKEFEGLSPTIERPIKEQAVKIDLLVYNDNPYILNEQSDTVFPEHSKFFNSSIIIKDNPLPEDHLILQRPGNIMLKQETGIFNVTNGLSVYAGESFIIDAPGPGGGSDPVFIVNVTGPGGTTEPVFTVEKPLDTNINTIGKVPFEFENPDENADIVNFFFWYRYEKEEYYGIDYPDDTSPYKYRRILTLIEDSDYCIYLVYKENNAEENGIVTLLLIKEDKYHGTSEELMGNPELSHIGQDDWNLILFSVDKINYSISMSVIYSNGNSPVEIVNVFSIGEMQGFIEDMLSDGHTYYFGNEPESNGLFSIAQPFYLRDQVVNIYYPIDEIEFVEGEFTPPVAERMRRYYSFNNENDDIGPEPFELIVTGDDYFVIEENVNYAEDITPEFPRGSLKGSKRHLNLHKVASGGAVIFDDSIKPVTINTTFYSDEDSFTIRPENEDYIAKYFFGNTGGNHGIRNDRWFSVSGTVLELEEGAAARLVLRMDTKEEFIELEEGDFHFIFNNPANLVPGNVIFFIETNGSLVIKNDLIFTEGNYILPLNGRDMLDESFAYTYYGFGSEATIHFWFKPFNVNEDGFVNYERVLIDSKYITIDTYIPIGFEYACFRAIIYDSELEDPEPIILHTTVPVHRGWQHLQLSYRNDGDDRRDIAYFYVDGNIAAKSEGNSLPLFNSTDPLYIGADTEERRFAEGYFDEVVIEQFYKKSLFEDIAREPLAVIYNNEDPQTLEVRTISDISDSEISWIKFELESQTKKVKLTSETETFVSGTDIHGFDISSLEAGSYKFKIKAIIRDRFRYEKNYMFVKDDRPRFTLIDNSKLIMEEKESRIVFSFNYDESYVLDNEEVTKYPGVAIEIKGQIDISENHFEDFTQTLYLVKDFIDQEDEWIVGGGVFNWMPITTKDGSFIVTFEDVISSTDISYTIKSFYFETEIDIGELTLENAEIQNAIIPIAKMEIDRENDDYKLGIKVGPGEYSSSDNLLDELSIGYQVISLNPEFEYDVTQEKDLDGAGNIDLYYDDIFPRYGNFKCILSLRHDGQSYDEESIDIISWEESSAEDIEIETEKKLELIALSLLYLDKKDNSARIYFEYEQNGIEENILYDLTVLSGKTGKQIPELSFTGEIIPYFERYVIVTISPIPENITYIKLKLYDNSENLVREKELTINNSIKAPEILLTNTVDSIIAYDNVLFTWKGLHYGDFKPEIQYSYNFDDQGWSAPHSEWRSIELYSLDEGYHNFRVKAIYMGKESPEESVTFLVDLKRPEFDDTKITIKKLYDEKDVFHSVTIIGEPGAIVDVSLESLVLNRTIVEVNKDGSFIANRISLEKDGLNELVLSAYDRVNNFTDFSLFVENKITEIIFPDNRHVAFAPMTIIGKIDLTINNYLDIYVFDGKSVESDDFSGWKKAKINEDRTFFVEDIFVNPGTPYREAYTPLIMAVVFDSGKIFKRTLDIYANEIVMPIDMILSTHAVEGETKETSVEIKCKANVENISSWSIDFDGDGIYDDVTIINNRETGKEKNWTHTYSSIGLVKPRVRVITLDGNFFSVQDEIIIHEKIKEASNILIDDPISITNMSMEDGTNRIFVLAGTTNDYRIEAYEVGRNETYISNRLFSISLNGFSIDNPFKIEADNSNYIYIAGNRNGRGHIYTLERNEYGQYLHLLESEIVVFDNIRDIDSDGNTLYVTFENDTNILTIPLAVGIPDSKTMSTNEIDVKNSDPLSGNIHIAKDTMGILISDFHNQRILHLSDTFNVLDYFGSYGNGEKEFLMPSIIETFENRIFIYDEGRDDIQVFNPLLNTVAALKYDVSIPGEENYFEPAFLLDVSGISVIVREEGSRLYYYALILSRSTNKLAMIKLPQWEELRARVRNNKIVFLKDREVYTAKPSGSDLRRIISTDSIPFTEGTVDYPALSPDGRMLVFTSRIELYDGNNEESEEGNNFAYDNLYTINVNGTELRKIPLGTFANYEIEKPVFNSNGTKIIFSAKPTGGNWQIYFYNIKTGGIIQLFESMENARFPYYSPDDRFIVFTTDYDGDEEIEIFDIDNPSVRVSVTNNNSRDSFPVWNTIYPFEISDDTIPIESKIAFVSERGFHKGMYYVYLSRPSESDIRIVTASGDEVGDDPDSAAIPITVAEGDYPAFTGDGESLVFEHYDGKTQSIRQYNFKDPDVLHDKNLPAGAVRPSGMKNTISNFIAQAINGDEVRLTWTPYTDTEIFYTLQFRINKEGENFTQKKVFTQDNTTLKGLEMDAEYLFRVCIIENEEEAATTQWKLVEMPKVVARPTVEIDKDNPYLVRLYAWKPETLSSENDIWNFSWFLDNQEIAVQTSQDYIYEFSTSGTKTILLKASMNNNQYVSISEPVEVEIVSDIYPVIEYDLADDSSYIELSAENSRGNKIDTSSIIWNISGPGRQTSVTETGENTIVMLSGFEHKINVNLTIKRIPVNGQAATDSVTKNLVIDLDFREIKPVITYDVDKKNDRLFIFTGENSLGNIDWARAIWKVYADGQEIHNEGGVSSFAYLFPETCSKISYSVALTAARRGDSETETTAIIVSVEAAPIEPVIDYEILTLEEDYHVVGQKILFSCGNSRGSNIDFANAVWSVPVAEESYDEQSLQRGPTSIYNLRNIDYSELIEVSLTLTKRGGTDAVTTTQVIRVKSGEVAETNIIVEVNREDSATGEVFIFDVLSSTGPNLSWEKTEWLIDGQYTRKGPVVRVDVAETGEEQMLTYTCTIYQHGSSPIIKTGSVTKTPGRLEPFISDMPLGSENNLIKLSVLETPGINIDWEKTMWYIFDGNETVIQKQGSAITHAFMLNSEAQGYPVMVEMFFKGSSLPFVGYKTIDVESDELLPIITWDEENENWNDATLVTDPNIINFSSQDSTGGNIDWARSKWTFGDGTQAEYGPVVVHKFQTNKEDQSYTVSLTLFRNNTNGESESKTTYKTITIGSDEIVPVINARLYNNHYLVLSAEQSLGRGLLLDRAVWTFPGKGDTESYSTSQQFGTVERESTSHSGSQSVSVGTNMLAGGLGGVLAHWSATASYGFNRTNDTTSYKDYINESNSFSNQNMHTGPICRRYVEGMNDLVYASLYVYRMNPDGSSEGVSITVKINLEEANTSLNSNGVTYGK